MEGEVNFIAFIAAAIVVNILLVVFVRGIQDLITERRQKKTDELAQEILGDFDFKKERERIKSIRSRVELGVETYRDFKKEREEIKSIRSRVELGVETYRDFKKERAYRDFKKEREEIKSINLGPTIHCPKCSGMLVIRNGMYGEFWGCNRFPECRYTESIKS